MGRNSFTDSCCCANRSKESFFIDNRFGASHRPNPYSSAREFRGRSFFAILKIAASGEVLRLDNELRRYALSLLRFRVRMIRGHREERRSS
jgi:hypothetical protein